MKRRLGELLAGYFNGDLPRDQLAQRGRQVASPSFMGSPERLSAPAGFRQKEHPYLLQQLFDDKLLSK
jgi:hypothetical protein